MKRRATCTCGQLAVEVEGDPIRLSMCHCTACQRRTGSVFGVQARWLNEHVVITGMYTTYARTADSGNTAQASFCPVCGSTVFMRVVEAPDRTAIAVGAFADPTVGAPTFSVFEEFRHDWVHVPDGADRLR